MTAISKQAADLDATVAQAYLRRILGYEVVEVKEEYKTGEDGSLELQRKTEHTKHVPGDPRAAEFWLANRQRERWRPLRYLAPDQPRETGETGIVLLPPVEREGGGNA